MIFARNPFATYLYPSQAVQRRPLGQECVLSEIGIPTFHDGDQAFKASDRSFHVKILAENFEEDPISHEALTRGGSKDLSEYLCSRSGRLQVDHLSFALHRFEVDRLAGDHDLLGECWYGGPVSRRLALSRCTAQRGLCSYM